MLDREVSPLVYKYTIMDLVDTTCRCLGRDTVAALSCSNKALQISVSKCFQNFTAYLIYIFLSSVSYNMSQFTSSCTLATNRGEFINFFTISLSRLSQAILNGVFFTNSLFTPPIAHTDTYALVFSIYFLSG